MATVDSIYQFLSQLKDNNTREWVQQEKALYEDAKSGFEALVAPVLTGVQGFDPDLSDLTPKDCIFRLHRDTRFSKDKTPYKTHFGAAMSRGGKKSSHAGYYMHLEPGNSFLCAGMWAPPTEFLAAIRQEIDYHADMLLQVVENPAFKKMFNGLSAEDKLRTAPKGYASDHPQIEYLKLKNFICYHKIPDHIALSNEYIPYLISAFKEGKRLNDFLNNAVGDINPT